MSPPPDTAPAHIILENLDLRSGRPPYTFRAADGSPQSYPNNATSLYVKKGTNITIRCPSGFIRGCPLVPSLPSIPSR